MMIDDPDAARALVARMRASLPMNVTPSRRMVNFLRQRGGPRLKPHAPLRLESIEWSGDEGGIMGVIALEDEMLVVSLTHLRVDPKHPLSGEIKTYQRERTQRLATEAGGEHWW